MIIWFLIGTCLGTGYDGEQCELTKRANVKSAFEFECDSDDFSLLSKCSVWRSEFDSVEYFWTPKDGESERQLTVEEDCNGRECEIVEITPNGTSTTNFVIDADRHGARLAPRVEEFGKRHQGRYRCHAKRNCNGTVITDDYVFDVTLLDKQSSEPKGYLQCARGCEIGGEAKRGDVTVYTVKTGNTVQLRCNVIYPRCQLLTPSWHRDEQLLAVGEYFQLQVNDNKGKYSCLVENRHGPMELQFEFEVLVPDSTELVEIVAGVGIAVFMVVLAMTVVVIFKKCPQGKSGTQLQPHDTERFPMLRHATNPLQEPQNLSFAQLFESLIPEKLHAKCSDLGGSRHWIGCGHFGEVYLCTVEAKKFPLLHSNYDEKRRVAVKTWKVSSTDPNLNAQYDDIIKELNIMISVENNRESYDRALSQFVIQLIGCGMTPGETLADGITIKNEPAPFLVLEYAENGDLLKFLRDHKQRSREKQNKTSLSTPYAGLSYADLTKFAYQIACGMVFLSENKIVHRDLAARNILVSSDYTMKISDFGLSKEKDYYIARRGNKLPWKWMAIEAIQDHKSNVYTDVWSFGVTMWEIFSLGNQPYPTRTPEDVRNFLESGSRLDRPQYASRQMYQIMADCWKPEPQSRPQFRTLAEDLEKELETLDREKKLEMGTVDDSDSGLGDGQATPDTMPLVRPPPPNAPPPITPRTDI